MLRMTELKANFKSRTFLLLGTTNSMAIFFLDLNNMRTIRAVQTTIKVNGIILDSNKYKIGITNDEFWHILIVPFSVVTFSTPVKKKTGEYKTQ